MVDMLRSSFNVHPANNVRKDVNNLNQFTYIVLKIISLFQVNGSWGLPAFICDIYIAMDVTSSTSSIFNLVAISVDR